MFGLFSRKPKCPITPPDREWIEENYAWLIDQFGLEVLSWKQLVLNQNDFPAFQHGLNEYNPDDYLDIICDRMWIEPNQVQLELYLEDPNAKLDTYIHVEGDGSSSAGLYWGRYNHPGKFLTQLNTTTLSNPERMIATLAHELSHAKLLGEFRISEDREDHEYLTDLTAIFWGFGMFMGNSRFFHEAWSNSNGSGWSMQTLGYLPLEMMAYALALHQFLNGNDSKLLSGFLEKGMKKAFKRSMVYLASPENKLTMELALAKQKLAAGYTG